MSWIKHPFHTNRLHYDLFDLQQFFCCRYDNRYLSGIIDLERLRVVDKVLHKSTYE